MYEFILNIISNLTFSQVIGYFLSLVIINFCFIKYWKKSKFSQIPYSGDQLIHEGSICPLGGLIIFTCCFFTLLLLNNYFYLPDIFNYTKIFFISIPLLLFIVWEDIGHNIGIGLRFLVLFLTAAYSVIYWLTGFPIIELPFLSMFFENKIFSIVFYTLCLVGLMNGSNFIDGMNGLLGFYFLGAILACLYLCFLLGQTDQALPLVLLGLGIAGFLIFNFPFGKIFLGDAGAYFISFFLGLWVLNFFSNNTHISSWNAILLFFYPSMELIYSFVRKICSHKSPFRPDARHLHMKLCHFLISKTKNKLIANNLATIYLSIFWLIPLLTIPFVYDKSYAVITIVIIFVILYIFLNFYLDLLLKNKKNI